MRWPWSHRAFGAVEVGPRGNVVLTVAATDRRILRGTENPEGVPGLVETLIRYWEKEGQEYDRASDPGVFPLTASQNRRYGFPEDTISNLLFKRVFVLKNPRLEVIRTLARAPAYKRGLIRIEMKGPPPPSRGRTHFKGVTYVFGHPDRLANLVMDDGSVVPVSADRLNDVVAHLMGVYDPSR